MPVGRSVRRASREEQRLGLLEIARARGLGELDATTLPPGQRDASGFWFPVAYRSPLELFTPHQRSLQARQRALKPRRRRPAPAALPPGDAEVDLPLLLTDAGPAAPAQEAAPGPRSRDAEPQARRPPVAACVDSPGRSV